MKSTVTALLGAAGLAQVHAAAVQSECAGDVCYSVHVPQSAASSGTGDVYFQIKAPTSYTWAGFGQGTGMTGANIFVMYADASNTNVTLSPRYATGHVMPLHDTDAQVTLLEGSGITGGNMIANVLCKNCNSWGTGTMQFNDPSSSWIWAWKTGPSLASNALDATIEQHDNMGTFSFDLTKAAGGADGTNPFVTASGTSTEPSPSSGSGGESQGSGSYPVSSSEMMYHNMNIAHGTIMGLVMVVLLPTGAALRVLAPSSTIWLHAGVQMFSFAMAIVGMGLGIWLALYTGYLMMPHPIIGLVVVSFMSLQGVLGLLQHMHYRKHGNRSAFGHLHRGLGACLILLGIIDGGLGLQLAMNSMRAQIAYGVIAGIFGLAFLGLLFGGRAGRRSISEKRSGSD